MHHRPELQDLAATYTASWCSHDADSFAAFSMPDGSMAFNDNEPSVGRAAIAELAGSFHEGRHA